jgi:hypothetical protein
MMRVGAGHRPALRSRAAQQTQTVCDLPFVFHVRLSIDVARSATHPRNFGIHSVVLRFSVPPW